MLQQYLDYEILNIAGWSMDVGQGISFVTFLVVLFFGFRKTRHFWLPKLFKHVEILKTKSKNIQRVLLYFFVFLLFLGVMATLNLDYVLLDNRHIYLSLLSLTKVILIYFGVKIGIWILVDIVHNHYIKKPSLLEEQKDIDTKVESLIINILKYIIYLSALLWVLNTIHFDPFYTFSIDVENGEIVHRKFSLSKGIGTILIILNMRLVIWLIIEFFLNKIYQNKSIDYSHQFAMNQLFKYFIYVVTIVITLEYIGLDLTIIWGSAAALLVGIGLGLQDTFKDFVSGIVLLFERSIGVGDILDIHDEVGIVTQIGIRASLVQTNDKITVVVPNSQLVNISVNNWSSLDPKVRLEINVSVAYGSDVQLVEKLLIQAALAENKCFKKPGPSVLFNDFGDSGLHFSLLFFTKDLLLHRQIKSRIRFNIEQLFNEHNIDIPFPQQDIHIRSK